MTSLLEHSRTRYIVGGAVATCVTLVVARHCKKRWQEKKATEKRKGYPANTVILHQPPRGPYAPSYSPYPLKLETYLRMENIPYQNEFGLEKSSKDKIPWITYNQQDFADTQFIIEFLNKEFMKDPNSHLNSEQRAVARSMRQMTENSLFWVGAITFWVHNNDNYKVIRTVAPHVPGFVWKAVSRKYKRYGHAQGYGRHTLEELYSIGRGDLQALSDLLGEKAFLMGDQPCQEDCSVFGMLAQMKWHVPDNPIFENCRNLSDYCDRMKHRFWPDWDECNTAGGTKKATK